MLALITSTLGTFISWIGEVVTSLTTSTGALYDLLPILIIAICASLVMLGIKIVRKICWGA